MDTYVSLQVLPCTPVIKWVDESNDLWLPALYAGQPLTYENHLNAEIIYESRDDVPDLEGLFR